MKSYIPGLAMVSPGLLLKAVRSRPRPPAGQVRYFSRARFALAEVVRNHVPAGKILHVPSYICKDFMYSPTGSDRSIVYHPVCSNLAPDWEWLSQNTHPGDSLLLVHYFGFPNDLDKALEFCRDHELSLIEDCAHSFLTIHEGQTIGSFGDYGLYSYYKLLPLREGAGLVSRLAEPWFMTPVMHDSRRSSSAGPWLRQVLKYGAFELGLPAARFETGRANGQVPDGHVTPTQALDRRITEMSYRLMQILEEEYPSIIAKRRRNCATLLNAFAEFPEVRLPYPELGTGVCPQVFPMLLEDRDEVLYRFERLGIQAQLWPFLPPPIRNNPGFPVANWLHEHMLVLPVHQDLGPTHMEEIITSYRSLRMSLRPQAGQLATI